MAGHLSKVVIGLAPLIATLAMLNHFEIWPSELNALAMQAFEIVYSVYSSNQPYSTIGTLLVVLALALVALARRLYAGREAGYLFAPKGEVKLNEKDLRRLQLSMMVTSKDGVLERIIKAAANATSLGDPKYPLWIKVISKEPLARSILTGEVKKIYDIDILGVKEILGEFIHRLKERLDSYSLANRITVDKVVPPASDWYSNIKLLKNVTSLPKGAKPVKRPSLSWIWSSLIVAAFAFVILIILSRIRGIRREEAVRKAESYVKSLTGTNPILIGVEEDDTTYLINLETHSVRVDKKSGKIFEVAKIEKERK